MNALSIYKRILQAKWYAKCCTEHNFLNKALLLLSNNYFIT